MWRAWIGFNFSHSLGVLLFDASAVWAGFRINKLPVAIMPALILIGCVCLVLALRYWFRIPAIGVAVVGELKVQMCSLTSGLKLSHFR
jgi:hypothetical protein